MDDGGDSRAVVTEVTVQLPSSASIDPHSATPFLHSLYNLERTTSALFAGNDLRAVIFTGTDEVFASGANIRELAQLDDNSALEFSRFGQALFQTIADAKQLTIAAINGYCMGGGLDLAIACDIRVASSAAVFSHPGARLGIITGWGGTQRLPRIISRARALEFFATARRYTSVEALEMGLVSRVGDPVILQAETVVAEQERRWQKACHLLSDLIEPTARN